MKSLFVVGIFVAAAVCAGQGAPKKPAPKTSAKPSGFVCPDKEAQQACKSCLELLRAKDKDLPTSDTYVCFRKNSDDFFYINFEKPHYTKHWDEEKKQMVADPYPSVGYAGTYKDGVLASGTMPDFFFSGNWRSSSYSESGVFRSDKIDSTEADEKEPHVDVSITDSQFSAENKYKNRFEKNIQYSLTIQRSTGRFVESFVKEGEKIPFSEGTGYCIYR